MKKRRSIKKELLKTDKPFIEKRIAVLGGSTTHDIIDILELFLLNYGIRPTFYESEFNQYWQDAMFDNPVQAGNNLYTYIVQEHYRASCYFR